MLNNRIFNILFLVLILVWITADHFLHFGSRSYGWLLLIYITVIFCGSYFIRLGFFLKSICSAQTDEKYIALSFDDGPDAVNSPRILDILKSSHTEVAFFCIGDKISGNEELLKRIIREGHLIGNHSFSHHIFFDFWGSRKIRKDIRHMNKICRDITGLSPRFFRPPYGVTTPSLKKAVLREGLIPIGWSIRSFDTVIRKQDPLLQKLLKSIKPGAILLLHDTSDITVQILPFLLEGIQNQGYRIIRLDKLINLYPYA